MVLKDKPVSEEPALGLFSQPSYLAVGDKYSDVREVKLSRHKGRQFVTSPPRKGKTPDTYFTKEVLTLATTTKYVDVATLERKYENAKKKGNIVEKPFRPSSPPKLPTGLGSAFGTLSPYPEYKGEGRGRSPRPRSVGPSRPNFKTSPPKKGGFGYAHLTIGPEIEYIPSKYDAARELEAKMREASRKKERGPFISMPHHGDLFDPKVYSQDKPLPPPRKTKEPPKPAKPFVPSSPPKSGLLGTFSKFPEHVKDEYMDALKREKIGRKVPKGPAFVPPSPARARPTKSIALNYVDVRPHSTK